MIKKRILVIEDDADVAELLLMYFNSQGYEVYHADMGAEGIALARAKLPNLILLDIMLPDMEGFEVCQRLRNNTITKYIPTIFLTQRNASSDKVSGLQLGADDYITKPFDVQELRLRVQGSIQRATRDHLHERVTGLPTGPLITEISEEFQKTPGWHRFDVKVMGYDAFKDAYGFLTANDALGLAAKVLTDGLATFGTENDFIGTPENGHFVILSFMQDTDKFKQAVAEDFAERARALYRYTDVDRGYVILEEGTSAEKHVPLMHLEIALQNPVTA